MSSQDMQCPYAPISCITSDIVCVLCEHYISLFTYGIEKIIIKLQEDAATKAIKRMFNECLD